MKATFKLNLVALLVAGFTVLSLCASSVYAQSPQTGIVNEATGEVITDPSAPPTSCGGQYFLTFPAWYQGVVDANCEVISPSAHPGGFSGFIWTIVLNIVEMILNLVGYAAVAYLIWGGYRYMISAGSSDGMAAAKKTITNAVIGLVISVAAVAIVRAVSSGLGVG